MRVPPASWTWGAVRPCCASSVKPLTSTAYRSRARSTSCAPTEAACWYGPSNCRQSNTTVLTPPPDRQRCLCGFATGPEALREFELLSIDPCRALAHDGRRQRLEGECDLALWIVDDDRFTDVAALA